MEEEKMYLELYLDRWAAQVSLEATSTVPDFVPSSCLMAESRVLRTKDSAFIFSFKN